jgi:hypothetical protein
VNPAEAPSATKPDRAGYAICGCVVFVLLVLVVVMVWVVVIALRHPKTEDAPEPPSVHVPPGRPPWEPCRGRPASVDSIEAALTVADPRRVDVTQVFAQAEKLALELEPSARLTTIASNGLATAGAYDLVASNMSIHFEYRCLEPGKPPGQDRRQGQAFVLLGDGKARARRIDLHAGLRDVYAPFDVAPCGTVAAWRAVVGSSVPSDAQASFVLAPGSGPFEGGPIWIVDVPGHPEHRRDVEARTCARVMRGGRVVPTTPP